MSMEDVFPWTRRRARKRIPGFPAGCRPRDLRCPGRWRRWRTSGPARLKPVCRRFGPARIATCGRHRPLRERRPADVAGQDLRLGDFTGGIYCNLHANRLTLFAQIQTVG